MSCETAIGAGTTGLAVVAMVFDHLIDVEEGFPADPASFVVSVVLTTIVAAFVFVRVIPRTKAAAEREALAGERALICAVVAVPMLGLVWLGVPFPLAGGALALGLIGRRGRRRSRALVAIALGVVVLALGLVGTDWSSAS
jgi:protein-S-isoprenylcysteine O-methyltransferase Ste14